MTTLGVVPARGGSKGVRGKNLRPLVGKPLLVHTLRAARQARLLDRLVVSTDDVDIASVAEREGVEVVMRPPELAGDDSPTEDALLHVLDELIARGEHDPELVVTLEPTSPLRTAALIDRCIALAHERGANAVTTIVETGALVGRFDAEDTFVHLIEGQPRQRQLREPLYRESSTVYVTRTSHLRSARSVLAEPLYAVVVTEDEAMDVNTPLDLILAEAMVRAREEGR